MAPIRIRALCRHDTATIEAVFSGLSERSRYRRFHAHLRGLGPKLLSALADADGRHHVALVAQAPDGHRHVPVGIARYVLRPDATAEFAIATVDRVQAQGIGSRLMEALVDRARRAGVRQLEADILTSNDAVRRLLERSLPAPRFTSQGTTLHVTSPVVLEPPTPEAYLSRGFAR